MMKLQWNQCREGWEAQHNECRLVVYSPSSRRYYGCVDGRHLRKDNGGLMRWNRLGRAQEGVEKWMKEKENAK